MEVDVGGPRGTLMVEVHGERAIEAEKLVFPGTAGGVPDDKFYAGPSYNRYEEGPPAEGVLVDLDRIGVVKPGHGANEVVVHDVRSTDWLSGAWAKFSPRDREVTVETSRWSNHGDTTTWPLHMVGTVNASHDEHATESVFGFEDAGAAFDSL